VVAQNSPDGGTSEFGYDRLGRLAISRNAKQKADTVTSLYSYTKYDYLGRISEVGQIKNTVLADTIKDATSRNPSLLNTWLTSRDSLRGQITQTVYDLPYGLFIGLGADRLIIKQRNLRNRVSYVLYQDSGHIPAYSAATFYTYDIHGNVDTLLQDYGISNSYPNLMNKNGDGNRWKKIAYKYDLISGKVNMVLYQPGWGDQWLHRYSYDAENRLTLVETSRDSLVWERDARYEYYRHGPLARMTIGDQLVQGVDYAYTLQGWLKGVNSTGATATHDMGGDGRNSGDVLNRYTARDAYSYSLNYFAGDYAPINTNVNPFPGSSAYLNTAYRPLYNGNISSMVSNIRKMSDPSMVGGPILLYNYKYDQLNRLTAMDTYNGWVEAGNSWTGGSAAQPSFNERIAYDGNGNILKYLRNANTYNNGNVMDSLTYKYYAGTNRLRRVTDRDTTFDALWGSNSWEYNIDLDHQTDTSNYKYDAIGNLISDSKEGITSIRWSVYGKILEINRAASAKNPVTKIVYKYDPQGNRIGKIISRADTSARFHTWYVRDAQGNILSTYTSNGSATDANLQNLVINQTEKYIYGSSRLGVYTWYEPVDGAPYDMQYFNFASSTYKRGWRQYELTNHLGNVLVTVSDKKFGVALPSSSLIDYYEPDVVAAQDYFPFGMLMPRRSFSSASAYKFGFNGKENDNEVKGLGNQQDYGMRIYDGRVGRFLSVDPLTQSFPWYTPYQFAGNKPIYALDLDGAEEMPYMDQFKFDGSLGWFDWTKAIPNAVGRTWNGLVVDTWNSGVANVRAIRKGNWTSTVKNEIKQVGQNLRAYGKAIYKYNSEKSLKERLNDAGKYFSSPQALEDGLTIGINLFLTKKFVDYSTTKGPVISNALVPTSEEIFSSSIATRGAAERYALATSEYKTYWNANEFIGSNNKAFDLISTIERRVVDVTTTVGEKLNPGQFYTKLRALENATNIPSGYGKTLQIYIKAEQYTQAQVAELTNKLNNYIKEAGLDVNFKINTIK
jgi:RHS repeat-associated protein